MVIIPNYKEEETSLSRTVEALADQENARQVLALLREQVTAHGAAGILVTHSEVAAATCDRASSRPAACPSARAVSRIAPAMTSGPGDTFGVETGLPSTGG